MKKQFKELKKKLEAADGRETCLKEDNSKLHQKVTILRAQISELTDQLKTLIEKVDKQHSEKTTQNSNDSPGTAANGSDTQEVDNSDGEKEQPEKLSEPAGSAGPSAGYNTSKNDKKQPTEPTPRQPAFNWATVVKCGRKRLPQELQFRAQT